MGWRIVSSSMAERPRLLILSFSNIASDARVLKQVVRFSRDYDVVTCGSGEAPAGVVEHIRVPDGMRHNDLNGRLITAKLYKVAYWRISAVRWATEALSGRTFDVAIANDVEAVPVALALKPRCGVLADLHEYAPLQRENLPMWRKRISPWVDWLCRRYVSRASAWTTVSPGIAAEYERRFGFRAEVVTNAAPFLDAEPTPVGRPIRLVHSGGGMRGRALHLMVEAVLASDADITLDMYLAKNDPAYLAELHESVASSDRITIHEPVPYAELIQTLNGYDVGVFVLPPNTFNHRYVLPNKLFDYIEARLGVLIGPSVEMVRYVDEYGIGAVADDFSAEGLREAIDRLTTETVATYKANAHAVAAELSSDRQVDIWERILKNQLERGRP
jgi:hypothetical protein